MTPDRRDLVNTILEIAAMVIVIVFWLIVWWPGILPTVAAGMIAYTRSHH